MSDFSGHAVVLLSGGADSATCLAIAVKRGFSVHALSFDYGQRNRCELEAAKKIAAGQGCRDHRIFKLDLSLWGGSALTDKNIPVPEAPAVGIPVTYVPARNLVFLSVAAAWGETLGARHIFIGVNSVDYSNYPDCRSRFIESFRNTVTLGTRAADEGWTWSIETPLQDLSKADIVRIGTGLGVDYAQTVSCYSPDESGRACGKCASCRLRREGFIDAGLADPTRYYGKNEDFTA